MNSLRQIHIRKRTFLLGAGVSVAALTAGCSRPDSLRSFAARDLDDVELSVWHQAILAIAPSGDGFEPVEDIVPLLLSRIDAYFDGWHGPERSMVGQGLWLLEYGAVVHGFSMTRFSRMQRGEAIAVLRDWQDGFVAQRAIYGIVRQLVLLTYFQDELTWPSVGYSGPTSRRFDIPSLGVQPMPESDVSQAHTQSGTTNVHE